MERLELSQQKLLEPKPSASTNSATPVGFFMDQIICFYGRNKSLKLF